MKTSIEAFFEILLIFNVVALIFCFADYLSGHKLREALNTAVFQEKSFLEQQQEGTKKEEEQEHKATVQHFKKKNYPLLNRSTKQDNGMDWKWLFIIFSIGSVIIVFLVSEPFIRIIDKEEQKYERVTTSEKKRARRSRRDKRKNTTRAKIRKKQPEDKKEHIPYKYIPKSECTSHLKRERDFLMGYIFFSSLFK